jgi:hypothetical protein
LDGGILFVEAPTLPRSLRAEATLPIEEDMMTHIAPQVIVGGEQYNPTSADGAKWGTAQAGD